MEWNEIRELVEFLNKKGKSAFKPKAEAEQIIGFELENRIQLPLKLKEWLLFSDGGDLLLPAGVQLYGVGHKPLIDTEDSDRPEDSYVVIGTLAMGDPILFKKNEETICIYNHEAGKIEDDEIYEDLLAFLKDLPNVIGLEE